MVRKETGFQLHSGPDRPVHELHMDQKMQEKDGTSHNVKRYTVYTLH